jgi:hypothetical protein
MIPLAIEQVVSGLKELEVVLGAAARPVLASVQARLTEAMAARDRGDPVAALQKISAAMTELAGLADQLDPQEAMLMRMVTERFRAALLRGSESEAKRQVDLMFEKSGALERKKS